MPGKAVAFAIVNVRGVPFMGTLSLQRKAALDKWASIRPGLKWKQARHRGYACVRYDLVPADFGGRLRIPAQPNRPADLRWVRKLPGWQYAPGRAWFVCATKTGEVDAVALEATARGLVLRVGDKVIRTSPTRLDVVCAAMLLR